LKKFLLLDKEVKFAVISVTRLRTSIKNFTSDEKFIQYLLSILEVSLERSF
jgi:predicted Zn-dependent protease